MTTSTFPVVTTTTIEICPDWLGCCPWWLCSWPPFPF